MTLFTTLCRSLGPLLLLLLLSGAAYWLYSPGVAGPVMLDDRSSLASLKQLADSPEQAWDYVLGENSGPLGRPVSMATFVLEQLLGDGSTATAKTVNITLHLLTGVMLAAFLSLLLSAQGVATPAALAVVFAALWLLAPLHVSTVLYVVQRMAMLAAFFSLVSLVCYLLWRRGLSAGRPRHVLLLLVAAGIVLAVLSKENGGLAVPLILLTEALWLQWRDDSGGDIPWLRRVTLLLIGGGALASLLLLAAFWGTLAEFHQGREFSLTERLLTQSRVLWDYVGQFFLPDTSRMGIYHDDVVVSRTLLQPRTTLYAMLGWVVLMTSLPLFWRHDWARRVLYGPLFFLVAHVMESSVWPLELYFEHRNYLPGVGLVVLPMCLVALAVKRWPQVRQPLLGWGLLAVVFMSLQTSSQVSIWSSRPLLMMQQVNGHPHSARANRDYASQLAAAGAAEAALMFSQRAYQASLSSQAASDEHFGDYVLRNVALACIAGQPLAPPDYRQLGETEPQRPLGQVFTMSVVIKLRQGDVCPDFDWDGFLNHLGDLYLATEDTSLASANMFSALAMLANSQQHWEHAYEYNRRHLQLMPDSVRGMLMQLHFTTALGREAEAKQYISRLQQMQRAGTLTQGERSTLALYTEK